MKPVWTLFLFAAWHPGLLGQELALWSFENLSTPVPAIPVPPSDLDAHIASASADLSGATNIGSPAACSGNETWATNFWPIEGAAQPGHYLSFELQAKQGYRLNINSFGFSFSRSSVYSANQYSVTYSVDGSAEVFLFAGSTSSLSCGGHGASTGIQSSNGGTALFKIYFYGQHPAGLAATIRIDDVFIAGASLLPVELTQFTGKAHDQGITLFWTTASEKNNARFEIERSHDGDLFQSIGRVEGTGNSDFPVHYRFLDDYPYPEINYYRLRQIDEEGEETFSPVIAVSAINTYTEGIRVFPNPVTSTLTVQLPDHLSEEARVRLFSLKGIEYKNWIPDLGTRILLMDFFGLAPGTYLLLVQDKGLVWSRKILKTSD